MLLLKKRRGFTLIEVMASIAILLIMSSVIITSFNTFKSINRDIKTDSFLTELYNMISYSGGFCKSNKSVGQIIIDKNMKTIIFTSNNKGSNEIVIKDKISIPTHIGITSSKNIIGISSKGQVEACTLVFNNKDTNEKYNFKIRVGVDYINFEKQ